MKINFNSKVELAFLYLCVMGTVARGWVIPGILLWQQAILFVVTFLMMNGVWVFHYLFNDWLNKHFPFERNVSKRIVIQLLGGWTVVKTVLFLCTFLLIDQIVPTLSTSVNRLTMIAVSAVIFLVNVVISLGFIANHLFYRWQENRLRAAELEKEKVQVQLDNLKNQISPHFLFNSLSSLDSLIDDNPVLARQFLQQLSKVFRYVLQHKDKALVPVETELAFIKNYISLLKTRFDGAFIVQCKLTEQALEQHIVPITLQILIENAIKHNTISEGRPLVVTISANDGFLDVSNPIQRKRQVETSNQQGLENLKLLYSYLGPRSVEVEEKESIFCVRVPLIAP